MRQHRIVFAPTAEDDLDKILTWLSAKAPERVEGWLDNLPARIGTLEHLPNRCRYAPEHGQHGSEPIRQLLFTGYPSKYRILFTITDNEVRILNIRHGARCYLHE